MLEFFRRLFRGEPSGQTAKERLRLVLLSDHLALAPDVVEALKTELLAVISRYVEVDEANVDVTFEQRENDVAMLANIPIRSMKDRQERPHATVTALPLPEQAVFAVAEPVEGAAPADVGEPPREQVAAANESDAAVSEPQVAASEPDAQAAPPAEPKARKRRRRRAARAAARAQGDTLGESLGESLGTSAQA